MKNLLLTCSLLLMLQANFANAQTVYSYKFYNNLHASNSGPDLVAICTPTYVPHTFTALGGVTHTVCHFNGSCGFTFNDAANFLISGSYTIEMYVALDTVTGYRKLVDYMNLTDDDGLYENDGACTFRGPGNVSGSYFTASTYSLVTITRDGTTKNVKMFVDGHYVDAFNDGGTAVAFYNSGKMLRILQDDAITFGTETSGGNIAFLNIYNYAIDSTTAILHNSTIGATLQVGSVVEKQTTVDIAPNPATDVLVVSLNSAAPCDYRIHDMTGRNLEAGRLMPGSNNIGISTLPKGLYIIRIINKNGYAESSKFVKD